ncbi:MAG: hypothetical protein ACLVJC_10300, partial [Dorea formicigenerans]
DFRECGVERGRNADADMACGMGGKYSGECGFCNPKGDDSGCKAAGTAAPSVGREKPPAGRKGSF